MTVVKQNIRGVERVRWVGKVLVQGDDYFTLQAEFQHNDTPVGEMVFRRGDRFIETYYTGRWYSIFEIYSGEDGRFQGWYCDVGRPVVVEDGKIIFTDLALDLIIYPDGRQVVLDEAEFEALEISGEEKLQARQALQALQDRFK